MNLKKNKLINAEYAAAQALFWMDFCIAVCFAANYMQAKGFSNAGLGAVLALGNVLGFLLGSGVSDLIDRYERVTVFRTGLVMFLMQGAAVAVLLAMHGSRTAIACGFTVYIAFCVCVNGLNTKLCVDLTHAGFSVNYGAARGMGSLAFVLISLMLGSQITAHSVDVLPADAMVLVILQILLYLLLQGQTRGSMHRTGSEGETAPAGTGTTLFGFFRKYRAFSLLLIGNIFIFAAHNAVTNFMINIAGAVGGGTATMGGLNACMAGVEIPVMLLYSRFAKGKSSGKLLAFAYAMFTVKEFAIGLAGTIPLTYAAFTLQSCSFALYATAIVQYTDEAIPFEDSAKAQSLACGMTVVGSMAASLLAGAMYDVLPVHTVVLIWTGVCAVGSAVSIGAIRLGKKRAVK